MDKSQVRSCLSATGSITYDPLTGVIGGSGGGGAVWGGITGTLSDQTDLQSALDALVPYTGATNDVDLDTFSLNAKSLHVKGTGGAGHLGLKHQSANATANANETAIFADSNGDLKTKNDALYYSTFKTSLNTADRTYTFPDASGTLALTNQLPTPAALTKVDDTNVTLTLGGTPATALLQATSLTLGWSGQLSIARGGTGLGTLGTANQLLRVNAGATALEYFTPTFLTGLTVGTTPIASGTVGRILFEGTGNVVQQAANLFYDNTNSRLSLGMGASPTARLDVLGTGTGSTDISLRLRNSANTANLFLAAGSTQFIFGGATATPSGLVFLRHDFGSASDVFTIQNGQYGNTLFRVRDNRTASGTSIGSIFIGGRIYNQNLVNSHQFDIGNFGLGSTYGDNAENIVLVNNAGNVEDGKGSIVMSTSSNFYINIQTTKRYKFEANRGNFGIAQMTFGTSGTNVLAMATGVAPTTSPADCFQQYSADIVAGNAAPHFRTENNDIVKIYSIGGWGTPTGTLTRTTFATYGGATAGVLYDQTIMQNLIDAVKINSERLAALISDLKTGHQLFKA